MKLKPRRLLIWSLAIVVLALVSWSYTQPELMVDLASRAWACF